MKLTIFCCVLILSIGTQAQLVTNDLTDATSPALHGPIKVETPVDGLTIISRRGSRVSTNLALFQGHASRVVVTNEVDVPIKIIVDSQKRLEHRKKLIEEERQLGVHKDIRDRWDLLKEKEKGLKKGMTAYEVVKYMGFKPMWIQVQERISPEEVGNKRVVLEDIASKPIACTMNYSPYEQDFPLFKNPGMPYDMLWLTFDDSGKLSDWSWEF